RPSRTGRAPTERSSASTRRWRVNGPTGSPTAHIDTATPPCHTGSTTTTGDGHTARSETGHQSAAFTTSVGRTSSGRRAIPESLHRSKIRGRFHRREGGVVAAGSRSLRGAKAAAVSRLAAAPWLLRWPCFELGSRIIRDHSYTMTKAQVGTAELIDSKVKVL